MFFCFKYLFFAVLVFVSLIYGIVVVRESTSHTTAIETEIL